MFHVIVEENDGDLVWKTQWKELECARREAELIARTGKRVIIAEERSSVRTQTTVVWE